MTESIIEVSRDFFFQVLEPILEREFPLETSQTAFGVFGYGSEVLQFDDEYSSDHHWGLRINALMPDYLFKGRHDEILRVVDEKLPADYRGHSLREGLSGGKGLSLLSLEGYLRRTIGAEQPPETQGGITPAKFGSKSKVRLEKRHCLSVMRRRFGAANLSSPIHRLTAAFA